MRCFDTKEEAENFADYIKTRFLRFLVYLRKVTQNTTARVYAFVPNLDMHKRWVDEGLYKRYNLSQEEINFIEKNIREMK